MFNRVLTTTARKPPLRRADRNPIALLKRARHALAMHLSAEQLAIASRIDAKMQRRADEGNDDVAILGLYAQTLENSVKLDFRLPQSGAALAC